jgi:protein phosphatase
MEHTIMGCLMKIFSGEEQYKSIMNQSKSGTGKKHNRTSDGAVKHTKITRVLQPARTIRLRPEQAEPAESAQAQEQFSLSSSGITDAGLVRDHNEDSYSLLTLEDKSLFVVADGMGGHDSGEVASRTAADTVCRVVQQEHKRYDDLLPLVERALREANKEVRQQGLQRGSDMGTTLTVALISNNAAYIANVGDSRVYWMENGSISQITTDHSLVAKLVDAGKLTKEEARTHPRANLLYRTIGMDEAIKVDTFTVSLKKGGTLLLCTDGLWGELSDEEIHRICTTEKESDAICTNLLKRANDRGGKDNITAVVVKVV